MSTSDGSAGAPAGLSLLLRIRRKLVRVAHRRRVRQRDRNGAELADAEYARRLSSRPSAVGTMPGGDVIVALTTPPDVRAAIERVFQHRFDVLGSGPRELVASIDSARQARFDRITRELPRDAVAAYRPIEWHSDVIAGHRWDASEYYLDVRVAPRPGADIKVPRELSRFQHIGILAAAGSDEGLRRRAGVELALEMMDWVAGNPVRRGVNWASAMDVAIRAVNWIWGLRLFEDVFAALPQTRDYVVRSLYEHGLHIEENLEYAYERTTNHYLANVAGLLYIGAAFPQFPESNRWLHFGLQELVSEMRRQVYADGADFEASTHYHRLVAEMFLSCAALAERIPADRRDELRARSGASIALGPRLRPLVDSDIAISGRSHLLPKSFYESLARMVDYTAALTKPNGCVPQFGDNDSGRFHKLSFDSAVADVRDHRHLLAVADVLFGHPRDRSTTSSSSLERWVAEAAVIAGGVDEIDVQPAKPATLFPGAGVAVLHRENAYLAVTCGPNGQNGQGGHGHNDKGGLDLTIGGQDYVVDGGCFVYTSDPAMRNRFRSTEAHSTVWVEGREQDALPDGLAGLFVLPEHSRPRLTRIDDATIVAEHSGFGATHRRTFTLSASALTIDDDLPATGELTIGFNLDPSVSAALASTGDPALFVIEAPGRMPVRLTLTGVRAPRIDAGHFSLGYGARVDNQRILATLTGSRATSRFEWDA